MNTERPDNDDAAAEAGDGAAARQRETDGGRDTEPRTEADHAEEPRTEADCAEKPHTEADRAEVPRAEDGGSPGGPDAGGADDRPARRRSPAIVASVAAAVLLVGGGGAYLAAHAAGGPAGSPGGAGTGTATGTGTPPPLALDGYPAGGTPETAPGNGIAPGEPNPYGTTYRATGPLPAGPGSAPVYWADGQVTREQVARLAKALGIDGSPVAAGGTWQVGRGADGQGPLLRVNRAAPGAWTFARYAAGTDDCAPGKPVCRSSPMNATVDPVSVEAAKKAAAPVLKAVGQDTAKVDASQVRGARRVVNAEPQVGGLPTHGWTTGVVVGAQGDVVGGSGRLTAPVKGDTYPVLDARQALDLLNAAPGTADRTGVGGCASPVPLKDLPGSRCGASTALPKAPKEHTLTVEDAVFGLAAQRADGRQALVPSWLFTVREAGAADGFTVAYPAVDPDFLTSPAPSGTPSAPPSPRPTGPGDRPTGSPTRRDVPVDGYTATGSELTVAFTGGVCADYAVTARESAQQVTVKVTATTRPGEVCILLAKVFHRTVRLDQPLGGRTVVGSDGAKIPREDTQTMHPLTPTLQR
ncbi:hypothetical protein ACL02U_14945 [Streptomyces sp. MS06]|uniref:hypothetical protein n=1 Tax=Streptomyces sp. MS06 TaxID=3385974 RepID=UPI00399FF06C